MPYYAHAPVMGHLGRDVETKFIPSGKALHEFSIAVSDGVDKSSGNKVTSWYSVKVWGDMIQWKLDELKKGALVMVAGRLSIETWEKDGRPGSKVVITADSFSGVNVFGKKEDEGVVSRPRAAVKQDDFDQDIPF